MKVEVRIEGSKEFNELLDKYALKTKSAILKFVTGMVLKIHSTAVKGIAKGPATGRIYKRPNGEFHQASAPGEYPMSDSGQLKDNIIKEVDKSRDKPEGQVGTNLQHGKHLELKPAATGGRPWLSRAFRESTRYAEKLLLAILKSEARR